MDTLLPCPSCGSTAIGPQKSSSGDERNGYNFTVKIYCKCGMQAAKPSREDNGGWCIDNGEAEAEAIATWNRRDSANHAGVPVGARAVIEQCRAALSEELAAYDIEPPIAHVKDAYDACVKWLSGSVKDSK